MGLRGASSGGGAAGGLGSMGGAGTEDSGLLLGCGSTGGAETEGSGLLLGCGFGLHLGFRRLPYSSTSSSTSDSWEGEWTWEWTGSARRDVESDWEGLSVIAVGMCGALGAEGADLGVEVGVSCGAVTLNGTLTLAPRLSFLGSEDDTESCE
jgi:hypothetical protein